MKSSSVPKSIGVRPLVVGKSSFLESLEKALDKKAMEKTINNAARPIATELTKELRETAKADTEWASYAVHLSVVFKDLRFRISITEDHGIKQAVHKLEYGLLESPPRPLLRPFQTTIEQAYSKLAKRVGEIVVPSKRSTLETITNAVLMGANNA